MNPFKSFTFKWWQVALFKMAMISFGLALGATWSEFFGRWLVWFWLIFLVAGAYVTYAWYKQCSSDPRPR